MATHDKPLLMNRCPVCGGRIELWNVVRSEHPPYTLRGFKWLSVGNGCPEGCYDPEFRSIGKKEEI